jgi:hypothetical protein
MKVTSFLNRKRRSFKYLVVSVIARHVDKYLKIILLYHSLSSLHIPEVICFIKKYKDL